MMLVWCANPFCQNVRSPRPIPGARGGLGRSRTRPNRPAPSNDPFRSGCFRHARAGFGFWHGPQGGSASQVAAACPRARTRSPTRAGRRIRGGARCLRVATLGGSAEAGRWRHATARRRPGSPRTHTHTTSAVPSPAASPPRGDAIPYPRVHRHRESEQVIDRRGRQS